MKNKLTDLTTTTVTEIVDLHQQLEGLVKKSVTLIFEIGRRLTEVKESLDHGQFLPWIEQYLPFSERTARNYMRLYEKYKSATVADLEDKSIAEAYVEAGVKRLAAPEYLGADPVLTPYGYEQREVDWPARLAKMKTLTGIDLKRYRVYAEGNSIRLLASHSMTPIAAAEIYIPMPEPARPAYNELEATIRAAMEVYCAKMEELEDSGQIVVRDLRPNAVIKNMKQKNNATDVGPGVKPAPKPRAKKGA